MPDSAENLFRDQLMSLHAPWLSFRCLQVEPLGCGGKILEGKTDESLVSAGLGLVLIEDASAVHVVWKDSNPT